MFSAVSNFLDDSVTVRRKTGRSEDHIAESVLIGSFAARVEETLRTVTGVGGVSSRIPTRVVHIANEDRIILNGDMVTLSTGEEAEVTSVVSGAYHGVNYVTVTL